MKMFMLICIVAIPNKSFIFTFMTSQTVAHLLPSNVAIFFHPNVIIAVCKDSYVVYPVVLTETENENDSANQNDTAKMMLQKWHNHHHDVDVAMADSCCTSCKLLILYRLIAIVCGGFSYICTRILKTIIN